MYSFRNIPPVVKNLIIINVLFFVAKFVFQAAYQKDLDYVLGLPYITSPSFHWYQIFSHMFMHGDITHIFFNMFALFMFGSALEVNWGPKRFLFYYFFTAFGAVILFQLVKAVEFHQIQLALDYFKTDPSAANLSIVIKRLNLPEGQSFYTELLGAYSLGNGQLDTVEVVGAINSIVDILKANPTVGASGAVFGLLIAFAMYYPNTELMLIFVPIPIKAKYFVAIYAAVELYLGIRNSATDNIAHFAHLGGALFGFLIIKYWNKNNRKSFY